MPGRAVAGLDTKVQDRVHAAQAARDKPYDITSVYTLRRPDAAAVPCHGDRRGVGAHGNHFVGQGLSHGHTAFAVARRF